MDTEAREVANAISDWNAASPKAKLVQVGDNPNVVVKDAFAPAASWRGLYISGDGTRPSIIYVNKALVSANDVQRVLRHELGHALGLSDSASGVMGRDLNIGPSDVERLATSSYSDECKKAGVVQQDPLGDDLDTGTDQSGNIPPEDNPELPQNKIVDTTTDKCGNTVVMREGRYFNGKGYGRIKIEVAHGITTTNVFRDQVWNNCPERQGKDGKVLVYEEMVQHFTCVRNVRTLWTEQCDPDKFTVIRTVIDTNYRPGLGGQKGLITQYCLTGDKYCPEWVNRVNPRGR